MTRFRFAAAALVAVALAAPAAAETWQIDGSHSSVSFSVTHLGISTVRGEFGAPSGTIEFDGKDASSIKVDATVDANTINTRNERRDTHLKSADFFDVANNPTITFKTKKAAAGTKPGTFTLTGDLTLRGVTKEVTFNGTGPSKVIKGGRGESRVGASVSGKINRLDYGIKWNPALEGGGWVVSDEVDLTIDIEAIIPPPQAPAPPSPPPAGEKK
jgi:polyisoprenoid-binding protein YceI